MSLTDEEFRAKLEKHFSLYRITLRSPLASQVIPNNWYRVDVLLVNELGLFRRADIEPNGQVIVSCELYKPSSSSQTDSGITPFSIQDDDWEIEIRAAPSLTQGRLEAESTAVVPGFCSSGKGAFLYRIRPKNSNNSSTGGKRFLHIKPTQFINFPKQQKQEQSTDIILPLVIGPIEIIPNIQPQVNDTSLPLELWRTKGEDIEMVYEGYRVFSTSANPPVNIAIHEMWDSGIPGKIWDSALVMLDVMKRMIQFHPEYIDGKHTLDLSAGTGLLGLYIASMMASPNLSPLKKESCSKITITELDEAVDLIDKNIIVNQFLTTVNNCDLKTRNLLWGNTQQAETCGKADLIVASDVLYEAQFFEDLVKCFVDLSKPTTRIYIGYKRRGFDEAEEKRFWSLCQEHFNVQLLIFDGKKDIDDALVPPMTLETGVQLYRLVPL